MLKSPSQALPPPTPSKLVFLRICPEPPCLLPLSSLSRQVCYPVAWCQLLLYAVSPALSQISNSIPCSQNTHSQKKQTTENAYWISQKHLSLNTVKTKNIPFLPQNLFLWLDYLSQQHSTAQVRNRGTSSLCPQTQSPTEACSL